MHLWVDPLVLLPDALLRKDWRAMQAEECLDSYMPMHRANIIFPSPSQLAAAAAAASMGSLAGLE